MGHPDWDSFCGYLAKRYEEGAIKGGHEIRTMLIHDMEFDPVLHKGYKEIQKLEPDLVEAQENIKWADHFVVIYPNWWSTMPAKLKGFFDRCFLPGFSFRMIKNSKLGLWSRLMKGKTGRIVVTMDGIPFLTRIFIGNYTNEIKRGIFWFNGFSPTRTTIIGSVGKIGPEDRAKWGNKISELGLKAR